MGERKLQCGPRLHDLVGFGTPSEAWRAGAVTARKPRRRSACFQDAMEREQEMDGARLGCGAGAHSVLCEGARGADDEAGEAKTLARRKRTARGRLMTALWYLNQYLYRGGVWWATGC